MAKTKNKSNSLDNALKLLDLFSMDVSELGVTEIANKLGIAKSTAHRLLITLESEGFVMKNRETSRYHLGVPLLVLVNLVSSRLKILEVGRPIIRQLVEKTGESAHIAILKKGEVFYLCKEDCKHPVEMLTHIGRKNPPHCTSAGKVIFAYKPKDFIENYIKEHGLHPYTPYTITHPEEFLRVLKQIKQQGYAISKEELHEGITSIAAPITVNQQVAASVSIVGSIKRIHPTNYHSLTKSVIQAADQISHKLETL
ncbi:MULTISPECIES: IclR family transcriptional regulator [Bacillus]|uniref:IclR family transcriptional regulator n=1 Tax=Bacillus TaxID=1386 RepID=UPI002E1FB8F9|nr:IclR family transcriptional regulator [Bacillus smithii]MED4926344.1 IclR family transcriptional regulator [Bacillus smithii]